LDRCRVRVAGSVDAVKRLRRKTEFGEWHTLFL
jgi:hypothetical protein